MLGKLKRGLLISSGLLFTGLGLIGIFIPLLPTTVFLLMAAYCFAKSSGKFYFWLLNNKWFGSYIKNYKEKKGVTLRTKIFTLSLLWITILFSALFMVQNLYVKMVLLFIAIGVTIHLLTIRTYKETAGEADVK
jgi:uncharacterized protein